MNLHIVVSHLKDSFLALQLLAIVPSHSNMGLIWGDVVCFHFLEQKRRQHKEWKRERTMCSKDPYKSREGCLYHQTTQEPNKPSKRAYLNDHTITPSHKHPDWIYLNASCVQECVCIQLCVCVVIQFNKCSCVYSII